MFICLSSVTLTNSKQRVTSQVLDTSNYQYYFHQVIMACLFTCSDEKEAEGGLNSFYECIVALWFNISFVCFLQNMN